MIEPSPAGRVPSQAARHDSAPHRRTRPRLGPCAAAVASLAVVLPTAAVAQSEAAVEAERAAFVAWMAEAAISPAGAVAMARLNEGVTLGPDSAEIPLAGLPGVTVRTRGPGIRLDSAGTTRPIPRYRPVAMGPYSFYISGTGARATLIVYHPEASARSDPPSFYRYRPQDVHTVTLDRSDAGRRVPMLALDGLEVEAFTAGTVVVPDGTGQTTLEVRVVPNPASEETELQIYFRDGTSGAGSYPAGRFVSLTPLGGDRYRLDFNRARNPFCAYSTVYPCPVPWPGNRLQTNIVAGERYHGGDAMPAEQSP